VAIDVVMRHMHDAHFGMGKLRKPSPCLDRGGLSDIDPQKSVAARRSCSVRTPIEQPTSQMRL
jgi:hypothetical protein